MDIKSELLEDLQQQARKNCISRAESVLETELAQTRARHGSRLHPSESLIRLEAFKLGLEQSKSNFANDEIQQGLEIFSTVHSQLNQLVAKLLRG